MTDQPLVHPMDQHVLMRCVTAHAALADGRRMYAVHFADGHRTALAASSPDEAAMEAIQTRATNDWDPVPWPDGLHTCGAVMLDDGSVLVCPTCGHEAGAPATSGDVTADVLLQYVAPNRRRIVSQATVVEGRIPLRGFRCDPDTEPEPEYASPDLTNITLLLDTQEPKRDRQDTCLYVDSLGNEWTLADCTLAPIGAEEPASGERRPGSVPD